MRLKTAFAMLTFLLTACSNARDDSSLAEDIWQQLLNAEAASQYTETLSPAILAAHESNLQLLQDRLPSGYPEPYLPLGLLNDPAIDPLLRRPPALSEDLVELGRTLFFDERLSFSEKHGTFGGLSCAGCHQEDKHFTDASATSLGIEGDATPRNSPTLLNVAYNSTLTWANAVFPILEMQARIPLFGNDPIEMGLRGKDSELLPWLLAQDKPYQDLFQRSFGLEYPKDMQAGLYDYNHITTALAAYERTLLSFDTRFDRFLQGQVTLTDEETLGLKLFFGRQPLASGTTLPCARCHSSILLSDSFHYVREGVYYNQRDFHNTGLYNTDGHGSYPPKNTGFASAAALEKNPALMGQFRTPPLRFVAETAPYGHDGSLPTLEAVIEHYSQGGKASRDPHGQNPFVDEAIKPGFKLTPEETKALIRFLETLSTEYDL